MHLILNTASTDYSMKSRFSRRLGLQNVESFKGKWQLEIKLIKPFPAFLGLMTMKYLSGPKEIVSHYGSDFRSHPIGTGPFQLKLWEENVKLVLRKNPYFMKRRERKCTALSRSCYITFYRISKVVFCNLYKEN
jgi:ABC-type oligopeptide transport system substrate-binding subunit